MLYLITIIYISIAPISNDLLFLIPILKYNNYYMINNLEIII